ncbi:MAG TPA: GNAT family N-acetyltransferase [Pyrinomonadaceae bacterium]|jgi:ribosomal-protein-alanine N-acetyltransferase|nr:GNAT family N-acetyltransferase [Pyrinomonadaceae bacterium]
MPEKKPHEVTDDEVRARSPVIETARLRLRLFRPDDLDELATMFRDPRVMRYVADGKPADREVAHKALTSVIDHWRRHGFGRWAVEEKETHQFLGYGGLRSLLGTPEVVYHFATTHWGKGFATELAHASLRFGFEEHQFKRIVAIAKPENAASIHVMEKLGMQYQMHTSYYDIDVVQYELSRENYKTPEAANYILKRSQD